MQPVAPPEAWTDWGGDGAALVFGHANGFPPATYRLLLDELSRWFSVSSFASRPLWPGSDPRGVRSWRDLAEDLENALDRRDLEGVLGVGHSLGSVLNLFAATAVPRCFRALVLIEPVVFSGIHILLWGALKHLGIGSRLPLIRGARRRRERFSSLEEVRASYTGKSVFATWDRQALDDYIEAGFVETGTGGVRLRYPKAWEARIFELTPANVWPELKALEVPVLVIRGAASDTLLASTANRIGRDVPTSRVVELPGASHFVPMERPRQTAGLIAEWARRTGV